MHLKVTLSMVLHLLTKADAREWWTHLPVCKQIWHTFQEKWCLSNSRRPRRTYSHESQDVLPTPYLAGGEHFKSRESQRSALALYMFTTICMVEPRLRSKIKPTTQQRSGRTPGSCWQQARWSKRGHWRVPQNRYTGTGTPAGHISLLRDSRAPTRSLHCARSLLERERERERKKIS